MAGREVVTDDDVVPCLTMTSFALFSHVVLPCEWRPCMRLRTSIQVRMNTWRQVLVMQAAKAEVASPSSCGASSIFPPLLRSELLLPMFDPTLHLRSVGQLTAIRPSPLLLPCPMIAWNCCTRVRRLVWREYTSGTLVRGPAPSGLTVAHVEVSWTSCSTLLTD
jgi:hypothetical protein